MVSGWNFGTLYGAKRVHNGVNRSALISHNLNKVRVLDFFFGNGSQLFSGLTHSIANVARFDLFEDTYGYAPPEDTHIVVNASIARLLDYPVDTYYTEDYLTALRCDVAPRLDAVLKNGTAGTAKDSITVAAHVRTGDLVWGRGGAVSKVAPSSDTRKHSKLQSIEGYFATFRSLKDILQSMGHTHINIVAYTSTIRPNSEFDRSMQEEFRRRGIQLIIDSEVGDSESVAAQTISTLAKMMTADVLLLASSTFSHVAGFYNPKCVIYETYDRPYQVFWQTYSPNRWIELGNSSFAKENRRILQERIPQCLLEGHNPLGCSNSCSLR